MLRAHWSSGIALAAIVMIVAGSAPAAHVGKENNHANKGASAHQGGHAANHGDRSGAHGSKAIHKFNGDQHLVAHGGGGGGGGGGHGFSGGGHAMSGGHSFGGSSHAFSGGGSHSFSGPSISHSFSGGSSRSFAPQNFSRGSSGISGSSGNWSHALDHGSSNWAHGQSNWQHGSSNWQSARNSSTWNQHLSNWNHGEQWNHNNHWWGNSNWAGHNNNWWHDGNWWGHGGWWGGGNWWWGRNFYYYPVVSIGAALDFPWWNDGYNSSYDYATPYYGSALYAPTTELAGQPDVVQSQFAEAPQPAQPTQPAVGSDAGAEYFADATTAFRNGQYRDALRLANHAAVESPQNAKAHELMSLALLASADYRGAAAEAHAALAFAPPAAWETVYTYYGDDATYTNQLRALEKYSHENPTAADARFLRAYQYLMLGHQPQALDQLREVTKLEPQDRLAAELLKKYGEPASNRQVPPAPAPLPANPGGGARPVDGGVDS
jgi:tetratricopeptide (TPR) repeat protein